MYKRGKPLGIAMLSLLLAAFANDLSVLAQSGSTGGTIGNIDKSLSGESPTEPRVPARPREGRTTVQSSEKSASGSLPCQKLLGAWTFSNGIGVVFKAGGDMSATNSGVGRWTCDGGMVAAHWSSWTDHYVISSDGTRMSGNSGLLNIALTATKN
jgi:hypothetical protein